MILYIINKMILIIINKTLKILVFLSMFLLTTGFVPIFSLLGPGMTILSSGNLYKAGAQYIIDQSVKKKTGKNTLAYISEEIDIKKKEANYNQELKKLVERRILETRKKLDLNKINQ